VDDAPFQEMASKSERAIQLPLPDRARDRFPTVPDRYATARALVVDH
jgi:hypothetical protein